MSSIIIPMLYVPSFYGDVRLVRENAKVTRIVVEKATPLETKAIRELVEHAVKKGWLESTTTAQGADRGEDASFAMNAPLADVQKRLLKVLKPGREMLTVVKFADGKMEEVVEAAVPANAPSSSSAAPAPQVVDGGGLGGGRAQAARVDAPVDEARTAAAATAVAKPTRGCPAPDFVKAELRATRVLELFLDDEQIEDLHKYNRFVCTGGFTGHRLMITSRQAKDSLAKYHRTIFDLDEDRPLCVHDWAVPASEEMLSLFLLATLPQHEPYLRRLEGAVA